MRCRVNLQSDPISLIIIAAEGKEHMFLDTLGDGGFVEVEIAAQPTDPLPCSDSSGNPRAIRGFDFKTIVAPDPSLSNQIAQQVDLPKACGIIQNITSELCKLQVILGHPVFEKF